MISDTDLLTLIVNASLVDILRGPEVATASHPQSLRWLWKLPCHEWRNVDYCCCWWRYCSSRRFRHFSRARLRRRRARLATCRPLCRSALSQRQPVDSCRPWIPEPTGCFRFEPDILEKYIDIINSFVNVVYGINNTKHGESGKGLVGYRKETIVFSGNRQGNLLSVGNSDTDDQIMRMVRFLSHQNLWENSQ